MKYLRQVTGLGNTSFENLLADIACIQALFKRATGPFLWDEAAVSQFEEFAAIDASNHYFNSRTTSGRNQEDECPITSYIDPKGYLKKAAGNLFVHTKENKVWYYKKHKGKRNQVNKFKKLTTWIASVFANLDRYVSALRRQAHTFSKKAI